MEIVFSPSCKNKLDPIKYYKITKKKKRKKGKKICNFKYHYNLKKKIKLIFLPFFLNPMNNVQLMYAYKVKQEVETCQIS